jgi:hypothetical protein
MGSRRLRAGVTAALLIAVPAPALAQPSAADRDTARELMKRGDERFAAKDFAAALKAYQSAHAIMQVPTTGLAVAKALTEQGQLVEARDTLLQIARLPKDSNETTALAKAREEAAALALSLADRIPSVVITLDGAADGVEVQVDGEAIPPAALGAPRKVNPGTHVITASSGGHLVASKTLSSKEGARDQVALKLTPGLAPLPPKAVEGGGATETAARPRAGVHIGVAGGPSTAMYLGGGGAFYGGTASFILTIAGTPLFDFRTGAMATFLYQGNQVAEQLSVSVPVMLKINYSSWLSSAAGLSGGFATDFHLFGYSVGPEWSLLTLSAGEKRQYELGFMEGLRFGTLGPDFHQAVVFTYLFLD